MPRLNFVFGLHFHQPTGQLKYINERIFEKSYLLLLDVFKKFSDLKFTVHISGPLLLYLRENHPEYLEELFRLGDIGTVEFMAGSIGEAILPLLPYEDRVKQITRYLELFEQLSGFRPRGAWLPERVWEPHLPSLFGKTGIEYVFIDDSTLTKTGHDKEKSFYAWNVEDGGEVVKVFFIDAGIRYILPWEHPDKVIEYFRRMGGGEDRVVVWGSDAEKFGEWMDPGHSKWWLEEFLNKMRAVRHEVQLTTPSEYLRNYGVKGLMYLDTGSYDKMLEWSRGFFRNFLVKYAESNNMHKKMLYVRKKMIEAGELERELELDYLLAQCNDAYWHGLFGGVYLAHLRQAIYEKLIRVEREVEEKSGYYSRGGRIVKTLDFDYDGADELIVETPVQNLYIELGDGGTLFEYDYKKPGLEHNLQDTMTRYPEPYLNKPGFNPDWYRRVSWRIHFWGPETSLWDWINNTPFKDMSDIALKKHALSVASGGDELILRAIGNIYVFGRPETSVLVEKRIRLLPRGHVVKYVVENIGERPVEARVGLEYHVAWKINRDVEVSPVYELDGEEKEVTHPNARRGRVLRVVSNAYPPVALKAGRDLDIWATMLTSYSRTEKGFLEMPQGLAIMFGEKVVLNPGTRLEYEVEWVVEEQ